MSRIALRGGVSGAALATLLLAVPAAHALAPPSDLGPGAALDATSDGRYVLFGDHVVDRTGAAVYALPAGTTALEIADHSPRVLLRNGDQLLVRDVVAGTQQVANLWDNQTVAAPVAHLVADGHRVVMQATQPNNLGAQSIIERDLDASTTRLRFAAADLLGASEDGRVVTFSRPTKSVAAPAGYVGAKNALGLIGGRWIGYVLGDATAPRLIDRSSFTQTCESGLDSLAFRRPAGLQVSQDGAAQRYVLTESRFVPAGQFQARLAWSRSTGAGFTDVFTPPNPNDHASLTVDPVSGAYVTVTEDGGPVTGFPTNVAKLVDGAGTSSVLPTTNPGAPAPFASWIYVTGALPVNGGASAIYSGSVTTQGTSSVRTLAYQAAATAPVDTKTAWATLPRTGDPVVTSDVSPEVSVTPCAATPTGLIESGYATFAPKMVGNSAGTVTFAPAPAGFPVAKSLTATVTFGGLRTWSRTLTTAGSLNLPSIPVGIPGFKLALSAKLTDGTVLTASAPLRRTR